RDAIWRGLRYRRLSPFAGRAGPSLVIPGYAIPGTELRRQARKAHIRFQELDFPRIHMERDNPDSLYTPTTDPSGASSLRDRSIGIIAFATVLALLYFGRDVLIPFTVALMLSLLIAPLVRRLRHIGLGRVPSVLVAVLISACVDTAAAGALGTQVLRMAESLPQ